MDIRTDLNLNGNKISDGKSSDITALSDDDSIVNKKFVDESTNMNDDLSNTLEIATGDIGGISKGDQIKDENVKDILSKLVFPLISPDYELPIMSMLVNFDNWNNEIGYINNITLTINETVNDATPDTLAYGFEGVDLSIIRQSTNTVNFNPVVVESNDWTIRYYYLTPSTTKNDSWGDPDTSTKYNAGYLEETITKLGYWANWSGYKVGEVSLPTNYHTFGDDVYMTKVVEEVKDKYYVTVPSNVLATVYFVIPKIVTKYALTKDGISITPAVETYNPIITDAYDGLLERQYTVFRHFVGTELLSEGNYTLEIIETA